MKVSFISLSAAVVHWEWLPGVPVVQRLLCGSIWGVPKLTRNSWHRLQQHVVLPSYLSLQACWASSKMQFYHRTSCCLVPFYSIWRINGSHNGPGIEPWDSSTSGGQERTISETERIIKGMRRKPRIWCPCVRKRNCLDELRVFNC